MIGYNYPSYPNRATFEDGISYVAPTTGLEGRSIQLGDMFGAMRGSMVGTAVGLLAGLVGTYYTGGGRWHRYYAWGSIGSVVGTVAGSAIGGGVSQ